MGMMQYNNPVIRLMVKAANMMIVSFYWVVCCLPVLTILPACAALYHSVAGVVMGRGTGVTKDFFTAFRDALRPGVSLTAVLGVLAALVCFGIYTGTKIWSVGIFGTIYMAAGILVGIPLAAMLVFVPPVLARFEGGTSVIVRLAMYFSGKHLLRSVWYLLLLAAAVWSVEFFPLLLLVIPAVYMDLIRGGTEKIMNQYIRESGLEQEQEAAPEEAQGEEEISALSLDRMLDSSAGEDNHG